MRVSAAHIANKFDFGLCVLIWVAVGTVRAVGQRADSTVVFFSPPVNVLAALELYYKSRHKYALSVIINYTQKRRLLMTVNNYTKYDEDFKKSLVSLHQNGKTQSQLCKEYGVSQSALGKWIKQYSTVETDDGEVLTAKQVKELQKRNAQLEEENLILKKAIAIFTPHSNKD